MLTKEKIHELVDRMPEGFSLEDVIERMILLQKLEIAREQIRNGDYLTQEELDKEVDTWD